MDSFLLRAPFFFALLFFIGLLKGFGGLAVVSLLGFCIAGAAVGMRLLWLLLPFRL